MKLTTKKYTVFILGATVFSGIILGTTYLDLYFDKTGVGCFSLAAKVLLSLIIAVILFKRKTPVFSACKPRYFVLGCLPFLFILLMSVGPIDTAPKAAVICSMLFGIIATVVSEELYFHGFALSVFGTEERLITALMSAMIFGISHAVNLLVSPWDSVLLQILLAFSVGLFTFGLFYKSHNLATNFLAHFLINTTSGFFFAFSSHPNFLGTTVYYVLYAILVTSATIGGILFFIPSKKGAK